LEPAARALGHTAAEAGCTRTLRADGQPPLDHTAVLLPSALTKITQPISEIVYANFRSAEEKGHFLFNFYT
jgi:hypothetical protein